MMHLVLSDRMEALAAALVEQLADERTAAGGDPFHPPTVIVSTPSIRAWLGFEIARRTGVAANIRFCFWREFLREPTIGAKVDVTVPDTATVQAGLVHELEAMESGESSKTADDAVLAPVRAYLAAGTDALGRERRRFQLAGRMARLFDEYALNRPDMITRWGAGQGVFTGTAAETEAWQRALWSRVFGPGGRLSDRDPPFAPASGLIERFEAPDLAVPPRVHLFGFSYVAESYHRLLAAIARRAEVVTYALATGPAPGGPRSPLARAWGRPGREFLSLLGRSRPKIEPIFAPPSSRPATLLGALQADILGGEAAPPSGEHTADGSLQILACPDIRRELEVIASEIWRLVRETPDLRFNEIALILNREDLAAYQTQVASVFDEAHDIPYTVIDVEAGTGSRIVEVVERLVELPFTRLTRADLLRIMTHPSVVSRYPGADPLKWVRWCESTGVFHGADHAAHAGTYIEGDVFHWDQGVRRVALGAFMTGAASGDERFYEAGGRSLRPEEPAGDTTSAAAFVALARSLLEAARGARELRQPLAAWAVHFQGLVADHVHPAADDAGEEADQIARCREALGSLAALDPSGEPVSARTAADFALLKLRELAGHRGRHLADGVVVSSFRPMRAVPFKVIFAAGLGEGKFPCATRFNALDLRATERVEGDVDPREQDRYLLLETVLSARARLFLSYVARDPKTGDELRPSTAVEELRERLSAFGLPAEEAGRLEVRHPLRRFDAGYFGDAELTAPALPAAHGEHRAAELADSLRIAAHPAPVPEFKALGSDARARLAAPLGKIPVEAGMRSEAPEAETIEVTLAQLRNFLACPLQGWARFVLGMREVEIDAPAAAAAEDERFEAARFEETVLLREALPAVASGAQTAEEAYEHHRRLAEAAGRLPTGFFGRVTLGRHVAALERWHENLAVLLEVEPGGLTRLHFGHAPEHEREARIVPPLEFDVPQLTPDGVGRSVRVRVCGATGALSHDLGASIRPVMRSDRKFADFLGGYVEQLVLLAVGLGPAGPRRLVVDVNGPADRDRDVRLLGGVDAAEARAAIAALVEDLLHGPHDYLLPAEWAAKLHEGFKKAPPAYGKVVGAAIAETQSGFGPVAPLDAFAPLPEEEGRALIERRFRHFPWMGG